MALEEAAVRSWAREHKAAWEMTPLVEMHKGERMQVGFELALYARVPPGVEPSDEAALEQLWDRLREVAESLLPLVGERGRIEIDPFEAAERRRPETDLAPEVLLQARLFHASDYFAPVADDDRQRIRPIEERLAALGLRARSW